MSNPKANLALSHENKRLKIAYMAIVEKNNCACIALNRAIEILNEESLENKSYEIKDLWTNGENSDYYQENSDESV